MRRVCLKTISTVIKELVSEYVVDVPAATGVIASARYCFDDDRFEQKFDIELPFVNLKV
jgi:hypothetical protein